MKDNRKGFILPIAKASHGSPPEGNSNVEFYDFLRRNTEHPAAGTEPSTYIKLNLDVISPGGGVEEHYHEPPVVDHVYYVISGRIKATVGDVEKVVGADTLIYCPSSVKHSVTNVGKRVAKVISIDASAEGVRGGKIVYSKIPTGGAASGKTWKVADK
jgi:mannose-6-phosphate isomerase-like protein (cupin superfamily)